MITRAHARNRALLTVLRQGRTRYGPAIRVPDSREGLRWWAAATDCHTLARGRFGDLSVALIATQTPRDGMFLVIGGPGAFEYSGARDMPPERNEGSTRIVDPWGNSIACP